jgi:hypothetical protein
VVMVNDQSPAPAFGRQLATYRADATLLSNQGVVSVKSEPVEAPEVRAPVIASPDSGVK